jgi:hypothetical protein
VVTVGLITGLLTLPLAPVRGVNWVAEQVWLQADREMSSREQLTQRLVEIEAAWQEGEISEDRRAELEEQVLQDLLSYDSEDERDGRRTH